MFSVRMRIVSGLLAAIILAAGHWAAAAEPDHKCDPVSDPGWNVLPSQEVTGESNSVPYQAGTPGNWFIDRNSTVLPLCNYFDDIGNYSLRSYSLAPRTRKETIAICRANAAGESLPVPPYAGPCPPR
jgi:hypothetical protein